MQKGLEIASSSSNVDNHGGVDVDAVSWTQESTEVDPEAEEPNAGEVAARVFIACEP